MDLIPAIDLRGGRIVRLREGRFDDVTVYPGDPVDVARRWADQGATRIHIVDLDGAEAGRAVQQDAVARVVREAGVDTQVAGGIRDEHAVAAWLAAGAERVVMGTALIRDPELARALVARHGALRIVAALDVRNGTAIGEGWRKGATGAPVLAALDALLHAGVETFAVTSIAHDGLLGGPDLALLDAVAAHAPGARIIASGGITSLADIRALAGRGMAAAILGRALYDGTLDLAAAIEVARDTTASR